MSPRSLATLGATLLVLAASGCSAPAGPSLAPSKAVSSASAPAASPTNLPGAVEGWTFIGEPASFRASTIDRIMRIDSEFVAMGCTGLLECRAPAIWRSADGVDWAEPTVLPLFAGEVARSAKAVMSFRGGLVVGGEVGRGDRIQAAFWLVAAGGEPERVEDAPSFADSSVVDLLAVGDRVLALGTGAFMEYSGFKAWHSDDGVTWMPAVIPPAESAYPTAGLVLADGILAWGPTCGVCPPETAFWRSADGVEWQDARQEIRGDFAYVTAIGTTDAGLVAFGTTGIDPPRPAAWLLEDGTDEWVPRPAPPQSGSARIQAHISVGGGALVAGTSLSGNKPTALIWLAGPGEAEWRPPVSLPGVEVLGAFLDPLVPDQVLVAGRMSVGNQVVVGLWRGSVDWSP